MKRKRKCLEKVVEEVIPGHKQQSLWSRRLNRFVGLLMMLLPIGLILLTIKLIFGMSALITILKFIGGGVLISLIAILSLALLSTLWGIMYCGWELLLKGYMD